MVFDLTQSVINSNQYRLVDDYSLLWRQTGDNCAESIFEIQTGSYNNSNLGISNYTVCQGVRVGGLGGWNDLGWGFCNPSADLINAYEAGDLRKMPPLFPLIIPGHIQVLFFGMASGYQVRIRYRISTIIIRHIRVPPKKPMQILMIRTGLKILKSSGMQMCCL